MTIIRLAFIYIMFKLHVYKSIYRSSPPGVEACVNALYEKLPRTLQHIK